MGFIIRYILFFFGLKLGFSGVLGFFLQKIIDMIIEKLLSTRDIFKRSDFGPNWTICYSYIYTLNIFFTK